MRNTTQKNKTIKKIIHKFKLLLIGILFLSFTLGSTNKNCKSYECRFSEYLKNHKITLVSPLERTYRFQIFKKNIQEIETFNLSHPEIKLDLNDFGLLTRREFKKSMTNPDFLFVDEKGKKHHVNVNDPRNEEVIDEKIYKTNKETLEAIKKEVKGKANGNPLVMLEWDLKDANQAVDAELERIHDFLRKHEKIVDKTELLNADGSNFF